jgi:ribosomal protein L37AE/L43A
MDYYIGDACETCKGNEYERRGARGITYCLGCESKGNFTDNLEYLNEYLTYAYGGAN